MTIGCNEFIPLWIFVLISKKRSRSFLHSLVLTVQLHWRFDCFQRISVPFDQLSRVLFEFRRFVSQKTRDSVALCEID